jgi:hypothetical protein
MLISWSARKLTHTVPGNIKTCVTSIYALSLHKTCVRVYMCVYICYGSSFSMTMLSHIDDARLLPSKQEVSNGSADDDSNTEPHIVRHEDEHEEVT